MTRGPRRQVQTLIAPSAPIVVDSLAIGFDQRRDPLLGSSMSQKRVATAILVGIPALALLGGAGAYVAGYPAGDGFVWSAGTVPVLATLLVVIARSLLRGEIGLDVIAAVAMAGSL